MIRAGKLDRQIIIQRETESVAASGAVSKNWSEFATVRAELVQRSVEEYLAGFGEADTGAAIFRIRYLAGITMADRVMYKGQVYGIEEMVEHGRRRSLELRCSMGARNEAL